MSNIESFNNPEELKMQNSPQKTKPSKSKVILISISAVILITLIAGFAYNNYYNNRPGPFGPMGFLLNRIADDLDLSPQQKSEVEKIKQDIRDKIDANRDKRQNFHQEMENIFRSDTFDKQKALELAEQQSKHQEEMRTFMIDQMEKFHSILTPQQRNKAADLLRDCPQNKKGFFGKGRKNGRGFFDNQQ